MNFEFISASSKYLAQVMALGKKNSSTLGFMPDGGFVDHAKKKHILIAVDNDDVHGYILFRINIKTRILNITHLCVDEKYRKQKIAIQLLDCLTQAYKDKLPGILLSCREDYSRPTKLWHEYGFVSKDKIRSRSIEENYLVKWWYNFNEQDLFSIFDTTSKTAALLDMNIIIKLRDSKNSANSEVQSLMADWLVDEVQYYFAQECYNEIFRDRNHDRINRTKTFVQNNFSETITDREESKIIFEKLKTILPQNKINDTSDIKQISDCISAGIGYFITLDADILNHRGKIEELYEVKVLSPEEFILEIDMALNDSHYQPKRLAGASHHIMQLQGENLSTYIERFTENHRGEKKVTFRNLVNDVIQKLPLSGSYVVHDSSDIPIAFWGYTLDENTVNVRFIRTHFTNIELTLFTQIVYEIIEIAIAKKKNLIKICDDQFVEDKADILKKCGFILTGNCWIKIAIRGIINSTDLLIQYPEIDTILGFNASSLISEKNSVQKQRNLYHLERFLYPLKFKDLEIPCYIIPIRRYWAGQLFDKYNTSGDIFGANPHKIWNHENVYYRSIKPVMEEFPARILWYVSSHKNQNRQKSIVASSYIDNVSVDTVKTQFQKFRKYGIYEWEDIFELAKYNIENKVKAIEFSNTEVFIKELSYNKIIQVLLENNLKKNTFVSPVKISNFVFNDLYLQLLD